MRSVMRCARSNGPLQAAVVSVVLAMGLAGAALPALGQGRELTAEEAKAHIGERGTVCGQVANTFYHEQGQSKPTFVNLDKPYPNHIFTIIIINEARAKFPEPPETYYRGKAICVSGDIVLMGRENVPHIFVSDPAQITTR